MRHLRPRRGLGQCFLTHEPTADALVAALELVPGDNVLEIGPGKGILTGRLLQTAGSVVAVELDERLAAGLRAMFALVPGFELVHADFMTFDPAPGQHLKVMGNLPYNLASQMLFRLLDFLDRWDRAVVTVQREFAERLVARPGIRAYGAVTVIFEQLTRRERLFNIEADRFKPRPDVVSTAVRISRRAVPLFEVADRETFLRVVKACFSQRRKTVLNSLAAGLSLEKAEASDVLQRVGITPVCRAETLEPAQFSVLAAALSREGLITS
jgi:16S rRNA (adenine1518-N6/adenine1519-N6)-dimethyltransferase